MKKFHDVILDKAGNIVVGAELYVRNNTTPFALVTIYSDNGVTTTANPVVSGSDGYCTFWTADNTLKLEVYVSGTLDKTITDYQHYDDLDAEVAALRTCGTSAADKLFYFTGAGTGGITDLPSFGRTLIANTTAALARTDLEIETDTDGTLAANSDTRIATQKATKTYVDANAQGLSWKQAVRVATTAALTLASDFENGDTVDGIVLATGNRILIKNQADATANGIYTVNASGAPTRATDMDIGSEFVGAAVLVTSGTANAGSQWTCTNQSAPTLGVTNITFEQIANGAGVLLAVNNLSDVASAATARSNLAVIAQGTHTIPVLAGSMTARTTNGAAAGTAESSTNKVMTRTLDFDASTDEFAQVMIPMPKSWNESTVTVQFIWTATATGDVVWGAQGVAISDDDVLDAAFGTAQTVTDSVTATTDVMESAFTAAITIAGTPAAEDLACFQFYRDADNGSDTLAADARLVAVRIKYTISAVDDA